MIHRFATLNKTGQNLRNNFTIFGLIIVAALGLSVLIPGKVFAAGGIGSGGSGSGGAGGSYSTKNGWSWALYDINSGGPSGGFRDGTKWSNIVSVCRNANASGLIIYGIANTSGNIKGYSYTQNPAVPFSGQYSAGKIIDGGRATAIPTSWAQAAFSNLPSQGVSTAGYTFGGTNGNVAWFCTGIDPVRHDPAGDAKASCNAGFQGWALDADDLNARLGVVIVIKRSGSTSWDRNLDQSTTANGAIPNPPFNTANLAAFGVTGNRGYTVLMPNHLKDGLSYDWAALAANATGTLSNPLGFSIIGEGSFNCPPNPDWDVGVGITCDADNKLVSFLFQKSGTISGNVSVTRRVNIKKQDGTIISKLNNSTNYNNGNWPSSSMIFNVSGLSLGDSIEASVSVSPGGPLSNDFMPNSASCPSSDSTTVKSKPYLRVYGNDVVVGRQFIDPSGTCGSKNTSATITAFAKGNVDSFVGAGSQFAVSATNKISGFLSANMHNGATGDETTIPDKSLTFFNDTSDLGGDNSAYTGCLPDYKRLVDEDSNYNKPSGSVTINTSNLSSTLGANNKVYIDGDLTINTNIQDSFTGQYNSLDDFKPIIVIVKGNINISKDVTQLDGLYVAMPRNDGTGGTINTCSDTGDTPTVSACNNKLTINGSFVANKVLFNRLKGDISSATSNEPSSSDNIAESFVFTSDLYFGLMGIQDTTDVNIKTPGTQYESIVGLPPVL